MPPDIRCLECSGTKAGLKHLTFGGASPEKQTSMSAPKNMKNKPFVRRLLLPLLFGLGYWGFDSARPCLAAVTNVNIIDFAFSPARVKINVNDQVRWTWT